MEELNFDPAEGEEVRVKGRSGVFTIEKVLHDPPARPLNPHKVKYGWPTVNLVRKTDSFPLPEIRWDLLEFVDETRPIRRFLEWLKQDESFRYPQGITGFRVDSEERFDGEPQFVVRFLVDGAAQPTREIVREWNNFTSRVREQILTLNLDRWVQVMVQKEQETMHATR